EYFPHDSDKLNLPGLREKTLPISKFWKKRYLTIHSTSSEIIALAKQFSSYRNSLHFLPSQVDGYQTENLISDLVLMTEFVNDSIVAPVNEMMGKNGIPNIRPRDIIELSNQSLPWATRFLGRFYKS